MIELPIYGYIPYRLSQLELSQIKLNLWFLGYNLIGVENSVTSLEASLIRNNVSFVVIPEMEAIDFTTDAKLFFQKMSEKHVIIVDISSGHIYKPIGDLLFDREPILSKLFDHKNEKRKPKRIQK